MKALRILDSAINQQCGQKVSVICEKSTFYVEEPLEEIIYSP